MFESLLFRHCHPAQQRSAKASRRLLQAWADDCPWAAGRLGKLSFHANSNRRI